MSNDSLYSLLGSSHKQTLDFFSTRLKDIVATEVPVDELFYCASVLAHHAQTSTNTVKGFATPRNLSDVFDNFVVPCGMGPDPELMEVAGAQTLFIGGYFADQMHRRHSIRWYAQLGSDFFRRAADLEELPMKAELLNRLSCLHTYEFWRRSFTRLSREFRDQPYLLGRFTVPPTHLS